MNCLGEVPLKLPGLASRRCREDGFLRATGEKAPVRPGRQRDDHGRRRRSVRSPSDANGAGV